MTMNFNSLATLGFLGATTSVTDIAGIDFEVSALTATTATLRITSVPSGAITGRIGYRLLKFANTDDFSFTSTFTPTVGTTVSITGLTEDGVYQMAGFAYDGESSRSEPGTVLNVRPSAGYTHVREICEAVKNILSGVTLATGAYNTELAVLATRDGVSYPSVTLISDSQVGRTHLWPYISIYAQDTALVEKYGTRKQWEYIIVLEVVLRSMTGDSRQLERDLQSYMEAAENVLDDNDTLGGTVWEAEIEGKSYSKILQAETGHLVQMGELLLRVRQTN